MIPKTIRTSIKKQSENDEETHWKISTQILYFFKIWDPLWKHLSSTLRVVSVFSRPVFWNLWGIPPWTDFGIPGAPLVRFSCLFRRMLYQTCSECQRLQSSILIFRKQMAPTTPSTNKQGMLCSATLGRWRTWFNSLSLTPPSKAADAATVLQCLFGPWRTWPNSLSLTRRSKAADAATVLQCLVRTMADLTQ